MSNLLKAIFPWKTKEPKRSRPDRGIPSRVLRATGFRSDSRGLMDRYIQVNGAWDEHLVRTREFILRAVAGKSIENLAVLGSGWLLDLPIDELAELAGHIRLYDACHPPQVIHRIRKFRNVTAIGADITGGCLMQAWHAVRQYRRTGRKAEPGLICTGSFKPPVGTDYIISLNLLSQIGIQITGFLEKHMPYSPEDLDRIIRSLQESHLSLLKPQRSCLITDVKETRIDPAGGKEESRANLLVDLPAHSGSQTWEWNFDPVGDYIPGKKTVMQVVALEW